MIIQTDDHKLLVELACSTTLAPAYKPALFDKLVPVRQGSALDEKRTVVFIVCGGFKISLDDAVDYRRIVEEDIKANGEFWGVLCDDGKVFQVEK